MVVIVEHGRRVNVSAAELRLARMVRRSRLRFETNYTIYFEKRRQSSTRCTPDLVFNDEQVAVFYDGCYWHECPEHYPNARGGSVTTQDQRNDRLLGERGWLVVRLWEHEGDLQVMADRVIEIVRQRRTSLGLANPTIKRKQSKT